MTATQEAPTLVMEAERAIQDLADAVQPKSGFSSKPVSLQLAKIVSNEADGTSTVDFDPEEPGLSVVEGIRRLKSIILPVGSTGVLLRQGGDRIIIGCIDDGLPSDEEATTLSRVAYDEIVYVPSDIEQSPTEAPFNWPVGLHKLVDVPEWATAAKVTAKISQAYAATSDNITNVWVELGTEVVQQQQIRWTPTEVNVDGKQDIIFDNLVDVTAMQGQTVTMRTAAQAGLGTPASTGRLRVNSISVCSITVIFFGDVTAFLTGMTGGGGGPFMTITDMKTTDYAASANQFVPVDLTGGDVLITLPTAPAADSRAGAKVIVPGSGNSVTIAAGGTDKFNSASGPSSLTLTNQNQGFIAQYKSGVWFVFGEDITSGSIPLIPGTTKTASTTALAGELVPCDTSGGGFNVNLPNAPTNGTLVGVTIVDHDGLNPQGVTITCAGSDQMQDGTLGTGLTLLNESKLLQYAEGVWYRVASSFSLQSLDDRYAEGLTISPMKTANYAADPGEWVCVDTSSQPITVTLPGSPPNGTQVGVKLYVKPGGNALTVATAGTDRYNDLPGTNTIVLDDAGEALWLQYQEGNWWVLLRQVTPTDDTPGGGSPWINVKDYNASGNYNPTLATTNAANVANINANNAAFETAWAVARSVKGTLYIPSGRYGLVPANDTTTHRLHTDINDAAILGEHNAKTHLWQIGPGTLIKQRMTNAAYWDRSGNVDTGNINGLPSVPPITGISIHGEFASRTTRVGDPTADPKVAANQPDAGAATSIGMHIGPGVNGHIGVRVIGYDVDTGDNPHVDGVGCVGSIGILVQNDNIGGGGFTEEYTFSEEMAIRRCTNGIVFDRGDGANSFGYNHFTKIYIQSGKPGFSVLNGAWLYGLDLTLKGNPGSVLFKVAGNDGGFGPGGIVDGSRVSGRVSIHTEHSTASGDRDKVFSIDSEGLWLTEGTIEVINFSGDQEGLQLSNDIADPGRFSHRGYCIMPDIPKVAGWSPVGAFGNITRLASDTFDLAPPVGDVRNNIKMGTFIRWCEDGELKYSVVSKPTNWLDAGDAWKVRVHLISGLDDMTQNPDKGSLRYSNDDPPDFPYRKIRQGIQSYEFQDANVGLRSVGAGYYPRFELGVGRGDLDDITKTMAGDTLGRYQFSGTRGGGVRVVTAFIEAFAKQDYLDDGGGKLGTSMQFFVTGLDEAEAVPAMRLDGVGIAAPSFNTFTWWRSQRTNTQVGGGLFDPLSDGAVIARHDYDGTFKGPDWPTADLATGYRIEVKANHDWDATHTGTIVMHQMAIGSSGTLTDTFSMESGPGGPISKFYGTLDLQGATVLGTAGGIHEGDNLLLDEGYVLITRWNNPPTVAIARANTTLIFGSIVELGATNGLSLGRLEWQGTDPNGNRNAGVRFETFATQNWTSSARGSSLHIGVTPNNGGAPIDTLLITGGTGVGNPGKVSMTAGSELILTGVTVTGFTAGVDDVSELGSGYTAAETDTKVSSDVTNNRFTKNAGEPNFGLTTNDQVGFRGYGGTTGIGRVPIYWVINPTTTTFQISNTQNGPPINLGGTSTANTIQVVKRIDAWHAYYDAFNINTQGIHPRIRIHHRGVFFLADVENDGYSESGYATWGSDNHLVGRGQSFGQDHRILSVSDRISLPVLWTSNWSGTKSGDNLSMVNCPGGSFAWNQIAFAMRDGHRGGLSRSVYGLVFGMQENVFWDNAAFWDDVWPVGNSTAPTGGPTNAWLAGQSRVSKNCKLDYWSGLWISMCSNPDTALTGNTNQGETGSAVVWSTHDPDVDRATAGTLITSARILVPPENKLGAVTLGAFGNLYGTGFRFSQQSGNKTIFFLVNGVEAMALQTSGGGTDLRPSNIGISGGGRNLGTTGARWGTLYANKVDIAGKPTYTAVTGAAPVRGGFDTTTITTPNLARQVRAMQEDLKTIIGLFG